MFVVQVKMSQNGYSSLLKMQFSCANFAYDKFTIRLGVLVLCMVNVQRSDRRVFDVYDGGNARSRSS